MGVISHFTIPVNNICYLTPNDRDKAGAAPVVWNILYILQKGLERCFGKKM